MIDFPAIALQCGPSVATEVIQRIVTVESSHNPFAIGVVGGRLERQPRTKEEAIVTAEFLANNGWNFSMGLAQINRYNLSKYGLDYHSVFDPCSNLQAAAAIYQECFNRASRTSDFASARLKAFSCYYSGNFSRGFIADAGSDSSYVQRISDVKIEGSKEKKIHPIAVISGRDKRADAGSTMGQKAIKADPDTRRLRKLAPRHESVGGVKQLRGE